MDHRAFHVELRDRTLELVGSGLGIGSRQRGESREALWIGAHQIAQTIVRAAREGPGFTAIHAVRSRCSV
jgi:hypothetical protein